MFDGGFSIKSSGLCKKRCHQSTKRGFPKFQLGHFSLRFLLFWHSKILTFWVLPQVIVGNAATPGEDVAQHLLLFFVPVAAWPLENGVSTKFRSFVVFEGFLDND